MIIIIIFIIFMTLEIKLITASFDNCRQVYNFKSEKLLSNYEIRTPSIPSSVV